MSDIILPTNAQLSALVASYLEAQPSGLGFVFGLASPGFTQVFTYGNLCRQNGSALAFTADTPFVVASVTKTFTATLYAYFLQNQSDPNLTLGDFPGLEIGAQFADIPLASLMSYTSGLPQDNGPGGNDEPAALPQPYSLAGMLGFLSYTSMKPGPSDTRYTYSNLGFALMGAVMPAFASAALSSYEELVSKTVFAPLQMSAQFFEDVRLERLPRGFYYDGSTHTIAAPGWPQFPAYDAAGGIVASGNDMMRWLQFNMGLLQSPTLTPLLPALQTPATTVLSPWGDNLGLSWFLTPASTSNFATNWKDGDLPGFSSYIALLPSNNPGVDPAPGGVFVLSNTEGLNDANNVEVCASLANDILYLHARPHSTRRQERLPPFKIEAPSSAPSADGMRPDPSHARVTSLIG